MKWTSSRIWVQEKKQKPRKNRNPGKKNRNQEAKRVYFQFSLLTGKEDCDGAAIVSRIFSVANIWWIASFILGKSILSPTHSDPVHQKKINILKWHGAFAYLRIFLLIDKERNPQQSCVIFFSGSLWMEKPHSWKPKEKSHGLSYLSEHLHNRNDVEKYSRPKRFEAFLVVVETGFGALKIDGSHPKFA